MKKNESAIGEIKKSLKSGKIVIGSSSTLKNMKLGALSKVFVSSNAPQKIKNELDYLGKLSNIDVVSLDVPNDELGMLCKKPYSVSVMGLKK